MSFSEKLKELRKEKGLTQEELAKEIFVSRTLISNMKMVQFIQQKKMQ